jgi:hypothetical protein
VDGENVMAVEVHQTSADSSDISFNLALLSGEADSGNGDAGGGDAGTASSTAIEYTGPITLSATTQVKARTLDGGEWSALNEATFTVMRAPELLINEFLADNAAVIEDPDDQAGPFDDWIEIYNPGDAAVDLGGLYLTDELAEPTNWQIPAGVSIPAGGFLLFWADNDTEQGDTHAGFQLNADGEEIGLFGSDGVTEIDSIVFEGQTTDVSYGRYPDGADTWGFMATPTPGAANEGREGN